MMKKFNILLAVRKWKLENINNDTITFCPPSSSSFFLVEANSLLRLFFSSSANILSFKCTCN